VEERTLSAVSILRVQDDDVETAVREAMEQSEALASVDWKGASVLIKPNVVKPARPGSGLVTDVRVTEAVTKLVVERDPGRVIIGDGCSVGYDFPDYRDTIRCMEVAGVLEMARKWGIEVVDLNRDEPVEVDVPDAFVMNRFAVAKTAWEADVVVDVPILKTHVRTGITCGLKNMKGVLPGREKKRTHQCGLDRGIVDLNRAMRPSVTVVDGIMCAQGAHTEASDLVPLNLIIAGNDVVAVDAVCAAIAGFDVSEILHVQLAAEAGLGIAELNRIEIRGESIDSVRHPFIPYRQAALDLYGGATIIEKNTCTGCMGELLSTIIYVRKAGFHDALSNLTLIMGTPDRVPPVNRSAVVVGKCAQDYRHLGVFVPGCPPHGLKITDGVCEALNLDKEIVQRAIKDLHNF
jgi:uncharacterized protein (DUF362 family)